MTTPSYLRLIRLMPTEYPHLGCCHVTQDMGHQFPLLQVVLQPVPALDMGQASLMAWAVNWQQREMQMLDSTLPKNLPSCDLLQLFSPSVPWHTSALRMVCKWAMGVWGGSFVGPAIGGCVCQPLVCRLSNKRMECLANCERAVLCNEKV